MIDMCVKANSEGGDAPLNGQPQSKRRRPLDDLSSVVGDYRKSRPMADSCEAQENQLPPVFVSQPLVQLPSPPVAHQQVAQTLPEDVVMSSPPARRRSLLMWNPKLRGKDERRKVLKISITKLRLIDDPEVFLRRSVLVNNTLKRLQKEIRDEKTSQRFYDVRSSWRQITEETCFETMESPAKRRRSEEADDLLRQESSDEEIFGVSSEIVRVSVPRPTNMSSSSSSSSDSDEESGEHNSDLQSTRDTQSVTCATQFRRLEDSVSVLDSVVYHSLIASLES